MIYFVIPVILFYILLKTVLTNNQDDKYGCVELLCFSVIIWAIELFTTTEILSLFMALDKEHMMVVWILLNILSLTLSIVIFFIKRKKMSLLFRKEIEIINGFKQNQKTSLLLLIPSVVFVVFVINVAINTVPYNGDSIAYHLVRIQMWAQNKTVAHFATNDYRQISSPVLAEFVNLYTYVLHGNDKFFNMVQCISYLFSSFMVYQIAKKRELSNKGALVALLISMSTPIAIAEAFSTQVDLFTTVWMMIFAYETVILVSKDSLKMHDDALRIVILGLSMGLGYITKQSVCIEMVVFTICLFVVRCRKKDTLKILYVSLLLAAIPAILVVLPEIVRNYITFGAIAAPVVGKQQLIGTISLRYMLVNFVKNLLFNLPNSYFEGGQEFFYFIVYAVAGVLKVDLNAEVISESGQQYVMNSPNLYSHDSAINPLNVWLFVIATLVMAIMLIKKKHVWTGFEWATGISYCVMLTVLRWEPYDTRYQVSYLMLLPVLTIVTFEKVLGKEKTKLYAVYAVLTFLGLSSGYNVLHCHKLLSDNNVYVRPMGYFAMTGNFREIQAITSYINIKKYRSLGYYYPKIDITYPVKEMCYSVNHLEFVTYDEYTKKYEDKGYQPDAIIWSGEVADEELMWHDAHYKLVYEYNMYHLYENIDFSCENIDLLIQEDNLEDYLKKVKLGNYTVFVTFNDGILADLGDQLIESFSELGISTDLNDKEFESYWFMLNDSQIQLENISDQFIYDYGTFDGKHKYEIGCTGYIHCDNYIKIDNYFYSKDQRGINIVVYDNDTHHVVDWANWYTDFEKTESHMKSY